MIKTLRQVTRSGPDAAPRHPRDPPIEGQDLVKKTTRFATTLATATLAALLGSTVVSAADEAVATDWTTPIGALGPDAQPGRYPHSCTAAVVHSPHHNVIMTAAHCLHPNMKFYPHFNHGKPDSAYGTYTVKAVIIPTEYVNYEESHQDKNNPYDFAFAVVQPEPNKKNVEDRTGALYPVVNPTAPNTPTSIGGYNQNSPNMSSCRGTARLVEWSQYRYVRVDCNGMNGGTSGSPFVVDNTRNVIGLMGGFDRGGDSTPGRNYSAHFSTIFAKYYAQAQNHS
ncbi:trypsin-like peptidase domain-containing protein [Kibdelosporangium lantanae]